MNITALKDTLAAYETAHRALTRLKHASLNRIDYGFALYDERGDIKIPLPQEVIDYALSNSIQSLEKEVSEYAKNLGITE